MSVGPGRENPNYNFINNTAPFPPCVLVFSPLTILISFTAETRYLGSPSRERGGLEQATADAVIRALDSYPEGDVLVFLPGVGEIRG